MDPIELSQDLIRCPSVTPEDAGALDVLAAALEGLGFTCHRLPFSTDETPEVQNLYARIGTDGPNFCFAGHTDVVPVGEAGDWTVDPFAAEIKDGRLYGRGASDMKPAIAAFVAAASGFLETRGEALPGSISLLITGDEEGDAVNGTRKVLDWLQDRGETLDACLVGEPTNPETLGEMIKIGRRGSLSATITVRGASGHAAYPHLADNPIHRLMAMLTAILDTPLDNGTEHFPPSVPVVTTFDVANPVTNVIPSEATARLNIRFNDLHTGASLEALLRQRFDAIFETRGGAYDMVVRVSGEAFLTPPGRLSDVVAAAVQTVTGQTPDLNTTGGTSDARFIKDHCPVCEFGLTNETAHKADENARVDDIRMLANVYAAVLDGFFSDTD
ncbi:MAG: succinyl-diaminopimelate desuccinylase [Rhodospirillales bacterium]|nr:succinyl-diaminopimelate desuccinylase [Alphaproteobacteria bacterium]MBL6948666.1 succinyl-diaminopimelate desuccinylase [Rhodospirillales bacterium]